MFLPIIIGLAGIGLGYAVSTYLVGSYVGSKKDQALAILDDAKKQIDNAKKETSVEMKDFFYQERAKFDEEVKSRRNEMQNLEKRLNQREENMENKSETLEKRERDLIGREKESVLKEKGVLEKEQKCSALIEEVTQRLERISGMTAEAAKKSLLQQLEEQIRLDGAVLIRQIEEETKETAERKAREIVSTAIQRIATEHTVESTVSVVTLPNEDMKGRIIGKEGRNIRALEMATGVDVVVDDTPEAVILSGFDVVRREIARITLERLIVDGRIHPARIEEVVAKVREEMETKLSEIGEKASVDAGIPGLHPEAIKLLGRLKYRTSYGQNTLMHSLEVCYLAGIMAAELGADVAVAKRGGLLHDIGKAVSHEVEGSHAQIGADMARKFNESPKVLNTIQAHHFETPFQCLEAVLVQVADAVSASRPGARREMLESYIKRLENLEKIADSFSGVERAFAIQAGREIRIIVDHAEVDDIGASQLARDIAKKVEKELEYPGQIKVIVIRETRAVEYAR